MNKNILYRRAVLQDCDNILGLIKELADFEKAPEKVSITLEELKSSGFGNIPIYTAYVAELDQNLIGLALYYIRFSTWKGKRVYLEDLIVNSSFRGIGIGKRLFEICLEDTLNLGYKGLSWQVLDWNEPAICFYKSYHASLDKEWINGSLEEVQIQEILQKNKNKKYEGL
jgi:GNAT superfamily N-acetyltransferase